MDEFDKTQTTEYTTQDILNHITDYHDRAGADAMASLKESKECDVNKWPVAWMHAISMRYLFSLIETLQGKVRNIEEKIVYVLKKLG